MPNIYIKLWPIKPNSIIQGFTKIFDYNLTFSLHYCSYSSQNFNWKPFIFKLGRKNVMMIHTKMNLSFCNHYLCDYM